MTEVAGNSSNPRSGAAYCYTIFGYNNIWITMGISIAIFGLLLAANWKEKQNVVPSDFLEAQVGPSVGVHAIVWGVGFFYAVIALASSDENPGLQLFFFFFVKKKKRKKKKLFTAFMTLSCNRGHCRAGFRPV